MYVGFYHEADDWEVDTDYDKSSFSSGYDFVLEVILPDKGKAKTKVIDLTKL